MLLAPKGLSTLWCSPVTPVIQASSAAVRGVAVGAGVLAAVLGADAAIGAALGPAHPPAASKTAAPSPAVAAFQPPRLMIAKNRPQEYSDGNIVPPTTACPGKDAQGRSSSRYLYPDITNLLPNSAPGNPST